LSDYTEIQPELDDFENAVYGEEVRDSMVSAIKKIYDKAESAADAPDASSATAGQAPIADGAGGWAWGDVESGDSASYIPPASSRYDSEDSFVDKSHSNKSIEGVSYTWDSNTSIWSVEGTSTGVSFNNLFNGLTSLSMPSGIVAGKTYYVDYEPTDSGIILECLWYNETGTLLNNHRLTESAYIKVPNSARGCVIRFKVDNGTTVDGTASDPVFHRASNSTDEIVQMLTTYGKCELGTGNYYVNNIVMPEGSALMGIGDGTVLHCIDFGESLGRVITPASGCTIANLKIIGLDEVPPNITDFSDVADKVNGIAVTTSITTAIRINNVTIENCGRNGIYAIGTGGGTRGGLVISNVKIRSCYVGIRFDGNSEYNKVVNSIITACNRACVNNGGNNVFVGCTFHGIVGFLIEGNASNSGHGTCVGCTFNHIDNAANPDTLGGGRAVFISSLTNGFVFDACQLWYGAIYISNSRGVIFSNCQMGDSKQNPHITVTGSYPVFFDGIIFHQSPVVSDSANSKFSNCFIDSDGSQYGGGGGGGSITVDSSLSATSTNPVQNKVIKSALDVKLNSSDVLGSIMPGSDMPIKSVAVTDYFASYDAVMLSLIRSGNLVSINKSFFTIYETFTEGAGKAFFVMPSSQNDVVMLSIDRVDASQGKIYLSSVVDSTLYEVVLASSGNDSMAGTVTTTSLSVATTSSAGLMSATDKSNLDTLMSDYQSASTALG